MLYSSQRQIDVMRCLVEELGASIAEVYPNGDTVLLHCARHGILESLQYLLEHGGAMTTTNKHGMTVWDLLTEYMRRVRIGGPLAPPLAPYGDLKATNDLVRVMVLRSVLPPELGDFLHPADKLVVGKGTRLQARLPA
jgi:hypothetical protein